ncbi:MAG: hypothetical protein L0312_24115 [Acidobacteria bacterium]|nr:hypothetical protein [Acidobacteriota bacterium]
MFVAKAQRCTGHSVFVGIDPGAEGALAFLCGPLHLAIDIPRLKVEIKRTKKLNKEQQEATGNKTKVVHGSTTVFDNQAIVDLFRLLKPVRERVIVAVEEALVQNPRHGRSSPLVALKVGWACGMWPLFLLSRGYRAELVKPGIWKPRMGLAGKGKEAARHKAMSMFPKASLVRKRDHNRAEALLLAEWMRRETGEQQKDEEE